MSNGFYKQTWLAAVENTVATKGSAIATPEENAIATSQNNAVQRYIDNELSAKPAYNGTATQKAESMAVQRNTDDGLLVEPTHVLIDGE